MASEIRSKKMLAHRPTARKLQRLGVVQFAVNGILGVHYLDGMGIIPDRKRVLLKVLALLICFTDVIQKTPTKPASDHTGLAS